jgi:hypothetical protein
MPAASRRKTLNREDIMQKVITASQWKNYRSNQEALIAASTGARLQGSTCSNLSRSRFDELEFSSGVQTVHYDANGAPVNKTATR